MRIVQPKVILFDWDNTLVDTGILIHHAMNHTLSHFDLPAWSEEETRKRTQNSGREGFPVLFQEKWNEAQQIFYKFYEDNYPKYLKALPGADSLLKRIYSKSIPIGIVSNKRGAVLRREVAYLGWQDFFSTCIGAGDALRDKPAPDPILLALEKIKHSSSTQVWFVGDAPVDWESAAAAGCWPIPVGFLHPDAHHYPQAVANCHELEKMLIES
jgi:phosphoglycolate phosphatase